MELKTGEYGLQHLEVKEGEDIRIELIGEVGIPIQSVNLKITKELVHILISKTGTGVLQQSLSSNSFNFLTPGVGKIL